MVQKVDETFPLLKFSETNIKNVSYFGSYPGLLVLRLKIFRCEGSHPRKAFECII